MPVGRQLIAQQQQHPAHHVVTGFCEPWTCKTWCLSTSMARSLSQCCLAASRSVDCWEFALPVNAGNRTARIAWLCRPVQGWPATCAHKQTYRSQHRQDLSQEALLLAGRLVTINKQLAICSKPAKATAVCRAVAAAQSYKQAPWPLLPPQGCRAKPYKRQPCPSKHQFQNKLCGVLTGLISTRLQCVWHNGGGPQRKEHTTKNIMCTAWHATARNWDDTSLAQGHGG
jgi:hypothetical protein